MVSIFRPSNNRKKPAKRAGGSASILTSIEIDTIEHQGVGVASKHSPVIFVEGALPGEVCDVEVLQSKRHFMKGRVKRLITASSDRQKPFCEHSSTCGGCQLDYIKPESLRAMRKQAIGQLLNRMAKVDDIDWQADIFEDDLGYRRKARFSIDARNPNKIAFGYRGAAQSKVVDIERCQILDPQLQLLYPALKQWVNQCDQAQHLGHVIVFQGDQRALIQIKATRDLKQSVITSLEQLGKQLDCVVTLESASGLISAICGELESIVFSPMPGMPLPIGANDFVQVNHKVNQKMVQQAIDWLNLGKNHRVLELFCGAGNFSLPLVKSGAHLLGVEGVASMVERAKQNIAQDAPQQCEFVCADLSDKKVVSQLLADSSDAVLMDPSREGASVVCESISAKRHPKIVYVSCNPASFARDTKLLMSQGYKMDKISLIEMFPYTKHTELMASFVAI